MQGFVKKLLFVLEAVAGINRRDSDNYVPSDMINALSDRRPGRAALKAILSFAKSVASSHCRDQCAPL